MPENHQDDDKTHTRIPLTKDTTVGHYRIVKKIGAGGMGEVYLAEDTELDRKVALKFLPLYLCHNEECRARFKREAQAAAKLDHPNIVTVHEVGEYQGRPYFAMAHVEGQSLKEFSARKDLSVEQILELGIQICEGLQAAHDKGITHRDIKPSNILIDSHGRARIVDFGLASVVGEDQLTKTGSTLGTIGYMSPEQVCGQEINYRSDLFSLGVVLYELITKQNPFKRDSEAATLKAVSDNLPEPMSRYRSGISDDLQRIINKLLDKNPDLRYQSAAEVACDLRRITSGSGITDSIEVSAPTRPSIAVLPFMNLSADPEQDYFCDGMAEEIINALTHIEDLRVVARTSSFAFKGRQEDIREIGRKLNVSTVLEGSVRKSGNRVRITGQLIKVSDGYHLWSEKFDRDLEDIFAVQDEISMAIVDKLKIRLLPKEESKVVKHRTEDTDSYQIYLMGRWLMEKRTAKEILKAIDCFQLAIEKTPGYALAYSGLAGAYILLPQYSSTTFNEAGPKAKEFALKAIQLDDNLAEAHISLAMIKADFEFDWKGGLLEFERAIELSPGNAPVRHWYGFTLTQLARFEEAETELLKAIELDPVSPIIIRNLGSLYFYSGQYDLAMIQLQKAFELDESLAYTHEFLGFTLHQQRKYEEALVELQKEKEISGAFNLAADAAMAMCYAAMGDKDRARQILADLRQRVKQKPFCDQYTHVANLCLFLGEIDSGFEMLDRAYQGREMWLTFLNVIPYHDSIKENPKFIALKKKMGFYD